MDFIEVKEETRDLSLHLTVTTDLNGRFLGFQTTKLENSTAFTNSSFFEHCPACQCLLNIVVVVHYEQENKQNITIVEEALPKIISATRIPSPIDYCSGREDVHSVNNSENEEQVQRKKRKRQISEEPPVTLDLFNPKCEVNEIKIIPRLDQNKFRSISKKLCTKCGVIISSDLYYKHIRKCANNEQPYCTDCAKVFQSWDAVKRHENCVHKRLYAQPCYICGEKLSNSFYLSEHLKGHDLNDMRPYKCELCQADFKFKKSIKEHMRRVHTVSTLTGTYECDQCSRKFKNDSTLQKHKKRHLPKPHKCRYCGKGWVYKSELEQHERTHEENRQFCCEICGRRYKEKTDLSKHVKKIHLNLPRKQTNKKKVVTKEEFQCELCSKIILGENSYLTHKILHNIPPGSLECSECGMKLKNEKSIKTHVFRQHLPKKFVCRFCGHPWRYKSELIQHEMIHTDTRPFECTKCNFKFKLKGDLNRHLQLHSKREDKIASMTADIKVKN